MSTGRSLLVFLGFLLLVFAVAGLGGLSTSQGLQGWYQGLDKPPWTPPSWAFGPVWTVLYVGIAVSAWELVRSAGRSARLPLALWAVQLVLNAAWSPLFFGLQAPGLALVDLVAMWVAILATAVTAWPHSRLASVLLWPYLAWVTLAGSLNGWVWVYN